MSFIPQRDRQAILAALEAVTEMVRQPYPLIACGDSDLDQAIEAKVVAARAETGIFIDAPMCGRRLVLLSHAYRCVECSRWFHRDCILAHFAAHQQVSK